MTAPYRVGIDIGGTFTDFVLAGNGSTLKLHKCLTTPDNPAEGALGGLRDLLAKSGVDIADVGQIVHGTTLVTNALIERRGAKTGLLTTCGFRDVLEMGFEQRYDIYDLFLQFPEPVVPRPLRREVRERMTRDGVPLRAPDLDEVEREVESLLEHGVEALAISFLHAYRNPEHEEAVAAHVRARYPDLHVSVSHEVVPEIREYERTNTTACNAYVQPLMSRYLNDLTGELAETGFSGHLLIMQSSGGSATVDTARRFPIRFLESGPAGGAIVASFMGRQLEMPELVAFDMGGTTAKAALIRDGRPDTAPMMEAARVHRFKPGSGLPINIPVVDMIEIGAGGGSIARLDQLGLLKVGPDSAGASPGPACYGQGGDQPTVTDACLLLGYFDPNYFLGGAMDLDVAAAESAYDRLAAQLGMSREEAAWGVFRVVCENMAQAARVHLIEKGQDPRRFALMAFGGAGPAHAARVARILGVSEVIVPRVSGVASALGFLVARTSFDFSRSHPSEVRSLDWREVQDIYDALEREGRDVMATAGIGSEGIRFERWADMRFSGQFHELAIEVPAGTLGESSGSTLAERFVAAYEERYHAALPGYEPMVLNWRLRVHGSEPVVDLRDDAGAGEQPARQSGEAARKGERPVYFPEASGRIDVPVFDRYRLSAGTRIEGPAVIEERESTTVIGIGDAVRIDALGNLRIHVGKP